jgi:hypothetical protein
VTLIDKTGPPRWSRWVAGQAGLRQTKDLDDCFSFQTFEDSILELLPDPPPQGYRFSAWVRHDSSDAGEAGLYFGHHRDEPAGSIQHSFCTWSFAERGGAFAVGGGRSGSKAQLQVRHYCESGPQRGRHSGGFAGLERVFEPEPITRRSPWRHLAVEVGPQGARAFWEDEGVGQVAIADVRKYAGRLRLLRPWMAPVDPGFPLRGGLGLYVRKSTASFRQVEVRPLGNEG